MLIYILNKRLRRIFEAGGISLCNSLNTGPGFYISLYLTKSNFFLLYKISQVFVFYFVILNIYRWFNITNIIPHSPGDGS